ncbi:MAG: PilN domain-containing protein [Planctomycetota bacterium]
MNKRACPNLMPKARVEAYRVARRKRLWRRALTAYAVVGAAACASLWAAHSGPSAASADTQTAPGADPQSVVDLKAALQRELASRQLEAQRVALVEGQPDFGVLMRLLAQESRDTVLLRRCVVDARARGDEPLAYRLELDGLAGSPRDAARFVLRLEDTGVFDSVRLLETAKADLDGAQVTGFRISCRLAQRSETTP